MEQKDNSVINNLMTKFLLPFMLLFGCYVQVFGEIAPGGGFQAGAIFASCLIAYDLSIHSIADLFPSNLFLKIGSFGALIYLLTGLVSLYKNQNFLNYYSLEIINSQALGIMLVEFGVGITVSSIMTFLYMEFKQ